MLLESVHVNDTIILLDLRGASAAAPIVQARFLFPGCAYNAGEAPSWCHLVDDNTWASLLTADLPVLSWT